MSRLMKLPPALAPLVLDRQHVHEAPLGLTGNWATHSPWCVSRAKDTISIRQGEAATDP